MKAWLVKTFGGSDLFMAFLGFWVTFAVYQLVDAVAHRSAWHLVPVPFAVFFAVSNFKRSLKASVYQSELHASQLKLAYAEGCRDTSQFMNHLLTCEDCRERIKAGHGPVSEHEAVH